MSVSPSLVQKKRADSSNSIENLINFWDRDGSHQPSLVQEERADSSATIENLINFWERDGSHQPSPAHSLNRLNASDVTEVAEREEDDDITLGAEFVDRHRADLIQRFSMVMPLADVMLQKGMLHNEAYSNIYEETTSQDKMRLLYMATLNSGGARVKAAFYKFLLEKEPNLVHDLKEYRPVLRRHTSIMKARNLKPPQTHTSNQPSCTAHTLVTASGQGLSQGNVNETATIILDTRNTGPDNLCAKFRTSGPSETDPCIVLNSDGTHTISYVPPLPGIYYISLLINDQQIPGSPFTAKITGGPAHMLVTANGKGLSQGEVNMAAMFTVDARNARDDCFCVFLEGPSETIVEDQDHKDGTHTYGYLPTEPGEYRVNIMVNNTHIPGSPFTANITGPPHTLVTAYGPGLSHGTVYQDTTFTLDAKKVGPVSVSVNISGPGKAEITTKDNGDDTHTVKYRTIKPGAYNITVKINGKEIPDSPYTANMAACSACTLVTAHGSGLKHGATYNTAKFTVDASKAGPVNLLVTINAPDKTNITTKDNGDGTFTVTYRGVKPGEYIIGIEINGSEIPDSPWRSKITGT